MKNRSYINRILALFLLAVFAGPIVLTTPPVVKSQTDHLLLYIPAVLNIVPNLFGIAVSSTTPQAGFGRVVEAGSSWIRLDLSWEAVESFEGQRNWGAVAGLEADLINAANSFFNTILIIGGTPPWAEDPGFACGGRIRADKFNAFANFARDVVARYSVPPYRVLYWELWNEPDVQGQLGCWGNINDGIYFGGSYYGEMLKVAYPKMKDGNPNAKVMVGGLLLDCDPTNTQTSCVNSLSKSIFMEGILVAGAKNSFDGVSFHAYDFYGGDKTYSNPNWGTALNLNGTSQLKKAGYLRELLNKYGANGKFLMNTEVGFLCQLCTNDPLFEKNKAFYVPQVFTAALSDGYTVAIWYSAFGHRNSGLIDTDLSPKPAFNAYKFTAGKLIGASSQRRKSVV